MHIDGRSRTVAVFAALLAVGMWSCTGERGPAGANGANGADGTNGTNGAPGANGQDGTNGTNGANGQNGQDGSNGTNGTNGTNGIGLSTGLNVAVSSVAVASDGAVTVDFTMMDNQNQPVDQNGIYNLGTAKPRFGLARLDSPVSQYVTLTRSSTGGPTMLNTANSGTGTVTEITPRSGQYRYVFPAKYPAMATTDASKTHTVFIQVSRQLDLFDPNTRYVANVTHDFVPAGTPVATSRAVVETVSCNQCHNPLSIHGGGRRDVKLCTVCHNADLGVYNLSTFVHGIHAAQNLDAKFGEGGNFSEVTYPKRLNDCAVCHGTAAQGANYNTNPSAAACTGCHAYLKFDGSAAQTCSIGTNWAASAADANWNCNHLGAVTATMSCTGCHASAMIQNNHVGETQYWNTQNNPPNAIADNARNPLITTTIDAVSIDEGRVPTFTFTIKTSVNGGPSLPRDLFANPLQTARFTYGLSASGAKAVEYLQNGSMRVPTPEGKNSGWLGVDPPLPVATGTPGQYTWKSPTALPANDIFNVPFLSSDTVGFELETADGDEFEPYGVEIKGITSNVFLWRFDNQNNSTAKPLARRVLVDGNKCLKCHDTDFGFHHAASRNNVQGCAMCHNAVQTDSRVTRNLPTTGSEQRLDQSIQFSVMIHKMHTGAATADPNKWPYYNNSGRPLELATYPGNLIDCDQCHVTPSSPTSAVWGLPLNAAVYPTSISKLYDCSVEGCSQVGADILTPKTTAVCQSCHDAPASVAHMQSQIIGADKVETCDLCHGPYKEADVRKLHIAAP